MREVARPVSRLALYWPGTEPNMSEPTKEELLARIAEPEAQAAGRKRAGLTFEVSEKGA